jgi:hypothetical protein
MFRKKITTILDIELFNKLAIDNDRNANDLIEEGKNIFLKEGKEG